jgi:RNA polymerase subunit RPABC4/transcription elongation factor Spt4
MSRFSDGLRIVPRIAWIIGITLYLGFATLIMTAAIPTDPEMKNWPVAGKIAFTYGLMLFVLVLALLIGYVYADAKRRGMRYAMWTWLAFLVPNGIGIILYFILRDPLPRPCPGCSTLVKSGFVFCPYCGTAMKPTCPNCGRAVEHGWTNCPECGSKLPATTPTPRTA